MRFRVGLFNDSFPPTVDGVANAVVNYALNIQKQGGEPIVVTPKYPHVTDKYPFEVCRYPSLGLESALGYRAGNPFNPSLIRDLRSREMDIYHSHCPFASSVLVRQLRGFRRTVPVVFTYHTKFDIEIDERLKLPEFRSVTKKFVLNNIKSADEVWVVSKGAKKSLRAMGYRGLAEVMENGTDFPRGLSPDSEIRKLSQHWNIEENDLLFVFVGRMMWYKNTKITIDALYKIRDKLPPFKMIFIGEGRDRSAMEQYVGEHSLGDVIKFAGMVHDRELLRTYFSRADLFLFPSTYDTSGLVVKEAAACDCPSLLVKGSCAAEGVEDGFSGFLAAEDADDVARVILQAVSDRDRLRQTGKNAAENVYLSWYQAIDAACKRYDEILYRFKYAKK